MIAFTIRYAAYAAQQCEDLFNLKYFMDIGEKAENECKEKYLLMTNRFMKMHHSRLFWDRASPLETNFGEQAYIAWNSKIPTFAPSEFFKNDGTFLHNSSGEYIDRGFNLSYKPTSFDGDSVEHFLNKCLDHSFGLRDSRENILLRTSTKIDAFLISGKEEEIQPLKDDGIELLLEDEKTNIVARASLLQAIGNFERKFNNNCDNKFSKKSSLLYFQVGAIRRARRTTIEDKEKQAK